MKKLLILLLGIFATSAACNLYAAEYIEHFNSHITVNTDGSMDVTETIDYVNTNKHGLHGIVREFPTRYSGPFGAEYTVGFTIISIKRDGTAVPYHIKKQYEGEKIYIGSANVVVQPGKYQYQILYRTTRQLGFHGDKDMLYWNVTGNGWRFPIKKATAQVDLPSDIPNKTISCTSYTGFFGSTQRDAICKVNYNNSVNFETNQVLQGMEYQYASRSYSSMGLTIQVVWPQGYITRPTVLQELYLYVCDNLGFLLFALAVLSMIGYYLITYKRIREAEAEEPTIPLFYPPKNLSPGAAQYILKQSYEVNQLTAEMVELAVNGLITIELEKKDWLSTTYILKKTDGFEAIEKTPLQKKLLEKLFGKDNAIKLTESNASKLAEAVHQLKKIYSHAYDKKYLIKNFSKSIVPALLVCVLGGIILKHEPHLIENMLIWTAIIPAAAALIIFFFLLRTYTKAGRKIRNEILGFKMFLEATESERLKIIGTPPTRTPELYEKYLPYAIALGVEQAWAHQFAAVFQTLKQKSAAYNPSWYRGRSSGRFQPGQFSKGLSGSIDNSLQSAYSSSGGGSSGGGGFSGGGRGGGGGGSW